jgi:hypothetical protein
MAVKPGPEKLKGWLIYGSKDRTRTVRLAIYDSKERTKISKDWLIYGNKDRTRTSEAGSL